jgi:uncharacterized membrane protein
MNLASEIVVNLPIEATFAFYADQDRLQEWVPGGGILEFSPLTPAPKKRGSRYRMAYRSLGITYKLVAELTVLDLNRKSVMEQVTGDYTSFHYEMDFTSVNEKNTRLTMQISATFPWGILGALAERVSRPAAMREFRKALERFKVAAVAACTNTTASNTRTTLAR